MTPLNPDRPPTDFLKLRDRLTPEETALVDRVRGFVDQRLLPTINEHWERAEFPLDLVPDIAELGIIGTTIRGYGCPGLGPLASGLVALEMSRGDGSINTFIAVQSGLAMGTIDLLGSDEQKERWLPAMARLDKVGAFALTEPDHGSDSVALESSARRDGDEIVLNGAKRWIGNGASADVVILWARDIDDGQVKAHVIEKRPDGGYPDGYEATVIGGKVGKRAILQADITLTNVRIPAGNRLAQSTSFRDVGAVLARTRSGAAWEATGHAMAAYEIALQYTQDRRQFGKPIAAHQIVQQRLAKMLAEICAMQLMCFRLAELQEQGALTGPMASVAKMFTAEKSRWVCAEARDLLGGNGLLLDNHVARHLTDMEVVHTYEGTDTIQALLVGREITGISAFR